MRRKTIGLVLAGAGSVGALALFTFLWSAQDAFSSLSEPQAGIAGPTMKDVRDHNFLWDDIHKLERLEQQGRIDTEEYRYKVIELSAVYLELEGAAADEFARVASQAVTSVRESFVRMRRGAGGYQAFQADMDAAQVRVRALLQNEPRHELFGTECGKWLRRLALGPAFKPKAGPG